VNYELAWQEIANIVNAGNSVKRYIKEIHKKWDNICATAQTEVSFDTGIHNSQAPFKAKQLQRLL
jgi:hypothetical protein